MRAMPWNLESASQYIISWIHHYVWIYCAVLSKLFLKPWSFIWKLLFMLPEYRIHVNHLWTRFIVFATCNEYLPKSVWSGSKLHTNPLCSLLCVKLIYFLSYNFSFLVIVPLILFHFIKYKEKSIFMHFVCILYINAYTG